MKSQRVDIFKDSSRWLPVASGQAELTLSSKRGALRMDFDFKGGRGFVVARCELRQTLPAAFVLRFHLRGHGPINDFEIKLADTSGQNVWRQEHKAFRLPARRREMHVANHEIEFAWGPRGGGELEDLGAIEFAIVAGEGGAGSMWLSDLRIEDHSLTIAPALRFSSALEEPICSIKEVTNWQAQATDRRPWLAIDMHEPHLIGGLVIDWKEQAPARGFRIRGSSDGGRWKTLYKATQAGGRRSYIYLPKLKKRHLQLELREPAGVRTLRWQGFAFSRSIEAFWHAIAANEPRGWHPRWLMREQSLWTPVGLPNGITCALINEQGMVEVDEGSFSIEPFVSVDGRVATWADVRLRQELREGWMPIPSVLWETENWRLHIEASASSNGALRVTYRIENLTSKAQEVKLFAILRPFQVTPPWQHFRNVGGVSELYDLCWQDGVITVNQTTRINAEDEARFGAMSFDEGLIASQLAEGYVPSASELHDAFGFASGLLAWEFTLKPEQTRQSSWSAVITTEDSRQSIIEHWQHKLPTSQFNGAGWAMDACHALLTATAHILITRSGAALQPGPRRYTRSWIRDGTIMSAALLRMGRVEEVRAFIQWYAPFQREDGFVPCCVDRDGPDWLVEHDSHGQWLALLGDYFAFTKDRKLILELWPRILATSTFIEQALGDDGLLPISVSHEGYLAQPVHSYWDDFWALRGLRDVAILARALECRAEAEHWQAVAERLSQALSASIEATRSAERLDSIPGSVEWADFDPTATANAVTLLDVPQEMNRQALDSTFDRYLTDWHRKRSGELEWSNYTPYEIRIIGAFVRMGRRDAALELLRFFLSDRRPLGWNQWPEIAWHDPKSPGHIGDVPHTWISAEYVLAVRSLFAYESETRKALVLAAGLAPEWIEGEGVRVHEMPTRYGALSYTLRSTSDGLLHCEISSGIEMPPGGILLRPPLGAALTGLRINGEVQSIFSAEEVQIDHLPARILMRIS